jgi:regulator of sigma E protease
MFTDLFPSLLSNVWAIFLAVLFFGASIFVHELGHFLAARRRGVHVARFSIGFGPKIFSWHGKDGVEYCLSWLPLGGYVALPQLADMRGIEGESAVDPAKLEPISYATKMIVFAAGATFNLLFAFLLACIIWIVGQPQGSEMASTQIGYIAPTIELVNGTKVVSPALQAGLRIGDTVRAIDGKPITDWTDLMQTLVTSAGRTEEGNPEATFTIERDGQRSDVVLHPKLSGDDQFRRIGIAPGYELIVHDVGVGTLGEKIGIKPGDEILSLDGQPMLNIAAYQDFLAQNHEKPVIAKLKRGPEILSLTVPPRPTVNSGSPLGLSLTTGMTMIKRSPFDQISEQISTIFHTLWSLVNPHSDIGLSKMAGPVGIVRIFHSAAEAGLLTVLMFTIIVNVNLAIFNLLPIPVLDGGHMLFATIARLRGRSLPMNFIMTTQSVFMALLFSMIIYVSFFDVRRWAHDVRTDRAEAAAPAATGK